jgi:hypothetical protein
LQIYPIPHAGHPSGRVPSGVLAPPFVFCIGGFLPSSGTAFSHEMIVPLATATSIALSKDFESFMM